MHSHSSRGYKNSRRTLREWTVRPDDCVSLGDQRKINAKKNKCLFRHAPIIMSFADISVESKYPTVMDIFSEAGMQFPE